MNNELKDVRKLIARGKFDQAKSLLKEIQSDSIEAKSLEAKLEGFSNNNITKAHQMFLDLEAVWPDKFMTFKMHAEYLEEVGEIEEALKISRQLIDKFPTEPKSYIICIDCLELLNRAVEAQEILEKALVNFPDNTEIIEQKSRLLPLINKRKQSIAEIAEIKEEIMRPTPIIQTDKSFLESFLELFSGRNDAHAVQTLMNKKWGYIPEKREMEISDVRKHLAGDITLGTYLVDRQNRSSMMVFDLDVKKAYVTRYIQDAQERARIKKLIIQAAVDILQVAQSIGVQLLVEMSGFKGLHFWALSNIRIPAKHWRKIGTWILDNITGTPVELGWELFPKQDSVQNGGLGNLVKVPLGIHRKNGARSYFLEPENFRPAINQAEMLLSHPLLAKDEFEKIVGEIVLKQNTGIIIESCPKNSMPEQKEKTALDISKITERKSTNTNNFNESFNLKVNIPLPESFSIEVEKVLASCKILWDITERAKNKMDISAAERHVLIYIFATIGDEGRIFLHQILNQLPDYDPDMVNREIKAVPPNPTSCSRIRKNLPELCNKIGCTCQFRIPDGCYESPVIYAGIIPSSNGIVRKLPSKTPPNLSTKEDIVGASAVIDRLMIEYKTSLSELNRLRERTALLRRQINRIFEEAGTDYIETKLGQYTRLPEVSEKIKSLPVSNNCG